MPNRKVIAIVPAAGLGLRFGRTPGRHKSSQFPAAKQYAMFGGRPLLLWALEVLERSPLITEIVPVLRSGDEPLGMSLAHEYKIRKVSHIVSGGAERQDSVLNALRAIEGFIGTVLIHDGVRPFLTNAIIKRTLEGLKGADGSVASVAPKDTIKEADSDGIAVRTPARDTLRIIQTPQVFGYEIIRDAYERAKRERVRATDDATLVERIGGHVRLVEGAYTNLKVTTREDMLIAEALVGEGLWAT